MKYAPITDNSAIDLKAFLPNFFGKEIQIATDHWSDTQITNAITFLQAIETYSPYLTKTLRKHPDLFQRIIETDDLDATYQETLTITDQDIPKVALEKQLRLIKQRAMLCISYADITETWPLLKITKHIAGVADHCLKMALHFLLREQHHKGNIQLNDLAQPELGSGLLLLTMGKHGAHELNYSSDIDFMIFFDPNYIETQKTERLPIIYNRLVRDLVQIMESPTSDGYVFRCDLRLRPDPGAMPLAIQFEAAINYYQSLGQNWERAAMIKSRPVFAEPTLAKEFEQMIQSWIWRRNLDFETILDIHSIKRQINTYHGTEENRDLPYANYNVKLGHGGIREIEFFVQTQQLIYGGKHPQLRLSQTCDCLTKLAELGYITDECAKKLTQAYLYLRQLEHRIQMQEDRQTHQLPDQIDEMLALAQFMGYKDCETFWETLSYHKSYVQEQYHQLFGEAKNLSPHGNLIFTGHEDDPETLETLRQMGYDVPEKVTEMVRRWHHGRYRATRSLKSKQILTEIIPDILYLFGQSAAPDTAILHMDQLLEKLPSGIGIFTLFLQHKEILPLLAEILSLSPKMAQHLVRHPEMVENLIHLSQQTHLPTRDYLENDLHIQLSAAKDYQDTLDKIRRWAKDYRFITGIHILKSKSPVADCHRCLSDIADLSLQVLLPRIEADFAAKYGKVDDASFALLALGKCGSRQMTFTSDIDLIAIYDGPSDGLSQGGQKSLSIAQYYMRLTQRLITACHAQMAEGRLYELDLRLRPAGEAGPIATSFDAFQHYYANDAWTWEFMSLLRSRMIAGDATLSDKVMTYIQTALTEKRDTEKQRIDIIEMREKMTQSFPRDNPWQVKHRHGGMIDIMFICQYLMLKHAPQTQGIIQADISHAIQSLRAKSHLTQEQAETLSITYQLEKEIQSFLRICSSQNFDPGQASDATKHAMVESCRSLNATEFDAVAIQLDQCAEKSWQIYQEVFQLS